MITRYQSDDFNLDPFEKPSTNDVTLVTRIKKKKKMYYVIIFNRVI